MVKKLYCFPHAGGSAAGTFARWKYIVKPEIEIVPMEMPGRGSLYGETFRDSVEGMVEYCMQEVESQIDGTPYGFWGNSLGTVVAYELALALERKGLKPPDKLLVSSRKPAHLENTFQPIHHLPDDVFLNKVFAMNGTSKQMLESEELKALFLPVLKNDFKAVAAYSYQHSPLAKISADITSVYGNLDSISNEDKPLWKQLTTGKFEMIELEGDHFFINHQIRAMKEIIEGMMETAGE